MKLLYFIICLLVAGMLFSCKGTKKIQTAIAKKDTSAVILVKDHKLDSILMIKELFRMVEAQRIEFTSFSAKIKVDYEDNLGSSRDFNAFVRIQKDSVIWISINAVLGIEAFRIAITKDSIKLLDKLDKKYQLRSLDYLQELAQLPFDFYTIQDLLVGNPIYLDSNIVSYRKTDNEVSLLSVGQLFKHLLTMNNDEYYLLQHSKLDDADIARNRTCDLTYTDYVLNKGRWFSTNRKITVAEKSKLDIKLNYKQYSFDDPLSFPFSIPKNYKQK
jgi:Domain of unknown function (DUF4292)